jgi:hypothetical protein
LTQTNRNMTLRSAIPASVFRPPLSTKVTRLAGASTLPHNPGTLCYCWDGGALKQMNGSLDQN